MVVHISIHKIDSKNDVPSGCSPACRTQAGCYCRFPKIQRVVWGRDPGTLKSDIVSKKDLHN